MARKQNKPSRYIRMGELEIERLRAGTKRDISHLEVRIAIQESCFPHPEGNSEASNWQREACILYTVARLVNGGILLLWITFSGTYADRCCRRLWINSFRDLRRPVLATALDQLFQVFACVHDVPPNGLGGGLRVPRPAYFE